MLKRVTLFLLSFLLILCLLSCKASNDIAKEVLDYEQELRNEIDKLNKEKPQYIRSYDKVCSVFCTYEFKKDTDTAKIINKYNMERHFSSGDIFDYDSLDAICIIFDRDDFTKSIARKIKSIEKIELKITNLIIEFETETTGIKLPNIEYYDKDATSISYEQVRKQRSGYWPFEIDTLDGHIIKTKEEYKEYLNYLLSKYDESFLDDTEEQINKQKDLYDESFFEENSLIITKLLVRGSGSINLEVNDLYVNNNKAYVVIGSTTPTIQTCDMQYTFFVLKVKKSLVLNVKEIITLD